MASRVSQVAVETLVQPDTQKTRVSQVAVETLVQPNTQRTRVSQVVVEVLVLPAIDAAMSGSGSFGFTGSGILSEHLPMQGTGLFEFTGVGLLSNAASAALSGTGAFGFTGVGSLRERYALLGTGAFAFTGAGALSEHLSLSGTGAFSFSSYAVLDVHRTLTPAELDISGALSRRAGVYTEIADNVLLPGWCSDSRAQTVDGLGTEPGLQALSHVSVCRMGDMKQALAVTSGDGVGGRKVASVRLQAGTEAFGYPHVAYQTPLTTDTLNGVQILPAYNPLMKVGQVAAYEKTLILLLWENSNRILIRVSNDRGQTWADAYSVTGDYLSPRFVQHPLGRIYLFYTNAAGALLYKYTTTPPPLWDDGITWAASGTIAGVSLTGKKWDITHTGREWLLSTVSGTVASILANTAVEPFTGSFTGWTSPALSFTPDWCAGGVTGGTNEFGHFPEGQYVLVVGTTGGGMQSFVVPDLAGGASAYTTHALSEGMGAWQYANEEEWNFIPSATLFDDRETWISHKTPSTYIEYDGADADFGNAIIIDNHGPDLSDDFSDVFGGFWTRSNEREAIAFPPHDTAVDTDLYFEFKFHKSEYHNIWFVIDDPANPGTPIFKADYYIGNDADVSTHPHDTARGLRIWFCKRPLIDLPPDGLGGVFNHPLTHLFDGYADNADNAGPWRFKIEYRASSGNFSLLWDEENTNVYIPFNPYGDREFVDVGDEDVYEAHPTEKYNVQPAGDLWPRRVYIGCPEVKPAIQKQSGITVGAINSHTFATPPPDSTPDGRGYLLPRLSGSLDLYHTQGDIVFRTSYGYPWQDVYTATQFRSSWGLSEGGPDQAELSMLNVDNYNREKIFPTTRNYNLMAWVKAGSRSRDVDTLIVSGSWGDWVSPFFGTSDTGKPTDAGGGPEISMRLYSPLREAFRSDKTQSFSSLMPPEVINDLGEPQGVVDSEIVRQQAIIYLVQFDDPHNPATIAYDDAIARYAWVDMARQNPDKLQVSRVGVSPANFTINGGGGDGGSLLSSMASLWDELGLSWHTDYFDGGILKVKKWTELIGDGTPHYTLNVRPIVSVPFSRSEDDWNRAGNVVTTVSNAESRPNAAAARTAPWPDGTPTVEKGIQASSGLASQAGLAQMYRKGIVFAALNDEWRGARSLTIPIQAFPYIPVGKRVALELDTDLSDELKIRFADLERTWLVLKVDTDWGPSNLTSSVTLVDLEVFPL